MAAARKNKPKPPKDNRAATQPSVRVYTTWTPALLKNAEVQADAGNLRQAANVCDWLLGDDRVRGTLDTRVQTLLGLEPEFEPSGDKRRSNRAVNKLQAEEDWFEGYPESELAQLHTWGLLLGVSCAQHDWQPNEDHGGRLLPRPEFWHPQHLRFDWTTRRWLTRTQSGAEVEVVAGDGNWILHTPYGKQRPWAMGLWRGLAPWVLLKHYARQDWARFGEKAATLAVTSPLDDEGETTKEQRSELAADIYSRGRDAVVVLPPGFDMKLVTGIANSKELYEAQVNLANTAIAVMVRGGNLTTESQGGSRAATESQERTGDQAKLKFDAQALTTTLHDQSLRWWADLNFGDPKLAPWPVYPVEPEEDLAAKAEQLNTVSTAADRLLQAGVPIDMVELCEQFDVPLLKGADGRPIGGQIFQYHVAAGIFRKNELRARLGYGPMPGGNEIAQIASDAQPLPDKSEETSEPESAENGDESDDDTPPEETDDTEDKTEPDANARMVEALSGATRAIVVGGPRSGKSTIAVRAGERHKRETRHADALVGKLKWSEVSEEVSRWIDSDGDWIIEGVSAARALRKWLKRNPETKLDATVVWLAKPIQARTKRQRAMAKGVASVFGEIRDELVARGARLVERDANAT